MAKFHGLIGFATTSETAPGSGIYQETIVEHDYKGDTIRNTRRWESNSQVNDNLVMNMHVSIVGDDYAKLNSPAMRYVVLNGVKWKITYVEDLRPRIIITLGGKYNGPTN